MKTINLIPKPVARQIQLELIASQILSFWITFLLSLAFFFVAVIASVIYLKSEIQHTDTAVAEQKQTLSMSNTKDLQTRVTALNQKINTIEELRKNHYYWSEALGELANILPADMRIDVLVIDRPSAMVQISGLSGTRESVLTFWSNVKKSNHFTNINFPLTNLEKATDTEYTFIFYIKPETIQHASAN